MAAEQLAGPVLRHPYLLWLVPLLAPPFHATASGNCPQGAAFGCASKTLGLVQIGSSKQHLDYVLTEGNDVLDGSYAEEDGSATEAQATTPSNKATAGTERHATKEEQEAAPSEFAQAAVAAAAAASFAGAASLKSAVNILGESMVHTVPVNGTSDSQQSQLISEAERASRMIRRHFAALTLRVKTFSSIALVAVVACLGALVLFITAYLGFVPGTSVISRQTNNRRPGNMTGKGTAEEASPRPRESLAGNTEKTAGAESADKVERDSYFCSEFVVPPGSECILKVHARPLSLGPFDVTDVYDNAVLHVEPRSVNIPSAGLGPASIIPLGAQDTVPAQRLVLTTEYGTVVAQCGPSLGRGKRECVLLRAGGDHYARIAKAEDQGTFVMSCLSGLRLVFCGSFDSEDKVMGVVDGSGRLVAKTGSVSSLMASEKASGSTEVEPAGPGGQHAFRLSVAPLVDVCLVLCGLLCIQHFL